MICLFLAPGFEETEAIAPLDIARRAGIDIVTVGIEGKIVTGSHGIPITADYSADELDLSQISGVVLPGGMPGAKNLESSSFVKAAVMQAFEQGEMIAAICAAPYLLGRWGILEGKEAICFPGYESELSGARLSQKNVVTDGSVITARAAGWAVPFGLAIAEYQKGREKADEIAASIQLADFWAEVKRNE